MRLEGARLLCGIGIGVEVERLALLCISPGYKSIWANAHLWDIEKIPLFRNRKGLIPHKAMNQYPDKPLQAVRD